MYTHIVIQLTMYLCCYSWHGTIETKTPGAGRIVLGHVNFNVEITKWRACKLLQVLNYFDVEINIGELAKD